MRMLTGLRARVRFVPGAASNWLSWAKVFAIAAVISVHNSGGNAAAPGAREHWLGRAAIYLDLGAVFAVPLFVMISGALLLDPARYQGARTFLKRRAWRLVPAIIFWHVFYFLFLRYFMGRDVSLRHYAVLTLNGQAFFGLFTSG